MDKQLIQYLREEAEEIKRENGEVASISELLETFLFPKTFTWSVHPYIVWGREDDSTYFAY